MNQPQPQPQKVWATLKCFVPLLIHLHLINVRPTENNLNYCDQITPSPTLNNFWCPSDKILAAYMLSGLTALKNVSNVIFGWYADPTNVSNVSVALRHNNPIPFWIPIPSPMIVICPTFPKTRKNHTHIFRLQLDYFFILYDLYVGMNFWTGLQGRIRSNCASHFILSF